MEENMNRAQVRNAVHRELFYFRKSLLPEDDEDKERAAVQQSSHDDEYTLMNSDTIINGKVNLIFNPFVSTCF